MAREGRIDSHQHFWNPERGDYPWMPRSGPLVRCFLPDDLLSLLGQSGFLGTVAVQAAPTQAETRWLLELAETNPWILGVVGWVDLEGDVTEQLDAIRHPKLVGIRPLIQDIRDDEWITKDSVRRGLRSVAEHGLTFDLLCYPRHLPHALSALEGVDDLKVVIDHLAKPEYDRWDSSWAQCMTELSHRPDTYAKISGLATEVSGAIEPRRFANHVDHVVSAFGPERCMAGTDWPVSTLALTFGETVQLLDDLVEGHSQEEKRQLWYGSANTVYGLAAEGETVRSSDALD